MRSNNDNNVSGNLGVGALAGILGGFALAGAAQIMYNLTSKQKNWKRKS